MSLYSITAEYITTSKTVALNSYFEMAIPAYFGRSGLEKQQGEEVDDLRERSVTRAPRGDALT